MDRFKIIFYYTLIFILLLFIQVYVINIKNLFGVKPDILLVAIIVFSLWNDIKLSSIYALIAGVFLDFMYHNNFGIYTLGFVLIAILIGYLNSNYRKDSKSSIIYITFLGTTIFELYKFILYIVILNIPISISFVITQIIVASILNMALSFVLYNVFLKVNILSNKSNEYIL